jgi:hypothetical protein
LQFASYPLLLIFPQKISRQLPGLTLRFIATLIPEKDVPLERLPKDKAAPDRLALRMHSFWLASN